MAPLIVMLAGWVVFRLTAAAGLLDAAESWSHSLRFALALMFLFTGAAHFVRRGRIEMVRMVPPSLPRPDLLVNCSAPRVCWCRRWSGLPPMP
jgi:hypothetical protein